ncbi:NYN domain-containing protein [Lyophyllum atratum]|nr:NYN domain-containing protein [Lyophyllum atratum]
MRSEDVAIFWDYENCPTSSSFTGYEVVKKIRCIAHSFGAVKLFKAYLELSDPAIFSKSLVLRSELQSSGVSLTDCPHNGRKDVADKMMLVDMLAYAIDNPAPSTIVLISGDRDFAYAVSILRLRRYRVVIISLAGVHTSLKVQASIFLDWNTEVLGAEVIDDYLSPRTVAPSRLENHRTALFRHQRERSVGRSHAAYQSFGNRYDVEEECDVDIMDHLRNRGSSARRFRNFSTDIKTDAMEDSPRDTQPHAPIRTPFSYQDEDMDSIPVVRSPSRTESAPALLYVDDTSRTPTVVNKPIGATQINDVFTPQEPFPPDSPHIPAQSFPNPDPQRVQKPVANPVTRPMTSNTGLQSPPMNKSSYSPSQAHLPPTHGSTPSTSINPSETKIVPNAPTASSVLYTDPKVVPPIFKLLVQRLEFHLSKGFARPFRSGIALELVTQDNTLYRRAGAERFGQYVAIAEKLGIIELGGKEGGAWIRLRPEWYNAKNS